MRTHPPSARRGAVAPLLALSVSLAFALSVPARQKPADAKPAPPATQEKPAAGAAQEKPAAKPGDPQAPKPNAAKTELEAAQAERLKQMEQKKPAEWTPETLAERVAIAYRGIEMYTRGRYFTSGTEQGRITIATTNGDLTGDVTKRFVTGPKMVNDRWRLDIIFETSPKPENQLRYTLGYNGASVWAAQNGRYTTPDGPAAAAFKASVLNDYTALFRYQEEEAKLTRAGTKKVQGLDLDVLDLTRPDGSVLHFFISEKTWRILHVEYDVVLAEGQAPVTFRESYSDWTVFQNTLTPAKRKLRQSDQLVQTIELNSGTYGATFEDAVFLQL